MTNLKSFAAVIECWPSASAFAGDIDVLDVTARAWKARGIPAEYWERTVAAAKARNLRGISLRLLARLAAARAGHAHAPAGLRTAEARA